MPQPPIENPFDPKKRLNLGSQNPVYRHGDTFVKRTPNPHVEEAASGFLKHLGVPHIPVTAASHRGTPYLHAPWTGGKDLIQADHKDLAGIDKQKAADTLFAEWLGSIGDRHGGNYKIVGGIPHSIDHGGPGGDGVGDDEQWEPGNSGTFQHPSLEPAESELHTAMNHPMLRRPGHPDFRDTPVSPAVLAAAKDPALEAHVLHGVSHLPQPERQRALAHFRRRVSLVTPGMRVGDLAIAHDHIAANPL